MKTILYLSHRIPYPPNKGDKIRSFNEIKYLARNNIVDLITLADDPNDLRYKKDLEQYCRNISVFSLNKKSALLRGGLGLLSGQSISQGYFYKKEFQREFDRLTKKEKYDLLICFSSPMAEYVFKAKKNGAAKILLIDFCDLDSDKWLQYAAKKKFPMSMVYQKEAQRLISFEKKINRAFHRSVFVSWKEAELFRQYYPDARQIEIIPNGVDHEYFKPDKVSDRESGDGPVIAFFGAMDYYANVDGVLWFAEKIWPDVKKQIPNAAFYIVGSNPDPKLKSLALSEPGITVTGFVKDIREYYEKAGLCVIPLRIARGIQNKVLEAMSMARAVIATPAAVQGFRVNPEKVIMVEEDPGRFAQKTIHLLQHPSLAHDLGQKARTFILENYCWEAALRGLDVQ